MIREIAECQCTVCESRFKLVYDQDDVSGFHKFCPFCGEELNIDEFATADPED